MRIGVGKLAKTKGSVHPRDARRIDQSPPRSRKAKPKSARPFGIQYESRDLRFVDGKIADAWRQHEFWYETRTQRDQALKAFRHRYRDHNWYRNHQPIDRASYQECDCP
jgi:hypothetical protein